MRMEASGGKEADMRRMAISSTSRNRSRNVVRQVPFERHRPKQMSSNVRISSGVGGSLTRSRVKATLDPEYLRSGPMFRYLFRSRMPKLIGGRLGFTFSVEPSVFNMPHVS